MGVAATAVTAVNPEKSCTNFATLAIHLTTNF